ncbi:unnamed protein product [Notodromas monacha]|uniref:Uncharacterized protein n=1 Tax=Notodromas monacha TaxID=399045 RepID=A0A7R9BL19_9CRUS|nr:unnamed protein product [Notodromas monacha]CAG0917173.1 unnamed protein product [Notodromas monacha]
MFTCCRGEGWVVGCDVTGIQCEAGWGEARLAQARRKPWQWVQIFRSTLKETSQLLNKRVSLGIPGDDGDVEIDAVKQAIAGEIRRQDFLFSETPFGMKFKEDLLKASEELLDLESNTIHEQVSKRTKLLEEKYQLDLEIQTLRRKLIQYKSVKEEHSPTAQEDSTSFLSERINSDTGLLNGTIWALLSGVTPVFSTSSQNMTAILQHLRPRRASIKVQVMPAKILAALDQGNQFNVYHGDRVSIEKMDYLEPCSESSPDQTSYTNTETTESLLTTNESQVGMEDNLVSDSAVGTSISGNPEVTESLKSHTLRRGRIPADEASTSSNEILSSNPSARSSTSVSGQVTKSWQTLHHRTKALSLMLDNSLSINYLASTKSNVLLENLNFQLATGTIPLNAQPLELKGDTQSTHDKVHGKTFSEVHHQGGHGGGIASDIEPSFGDNPCCENTYEAPEPTWVHHKDYDNGHETDQNQD